MRPRPRKDLLADLVEGRFPIELLQRELATYPWDSDDTLVTLRSSHIANILRRFLAGGLPAESVTQWARAIEMRDDVGFEDHEHRALAGAIFILANPDVNGLLTSERAQAMLVEISHRMG